MSFRYKDRHDAGRILAEQLLEYADRPDVLVLALPRGGVPVAYEIARRLHAPLDVFLVRKLGAPGHEELAMGAIAPGGVRVLNAEVLSRLDIPPHEVDRVAADELRELDRRMREYRPDRPPLDVRGRTLLLVDDGLATGSTLRAAITALRSNGPARLVVAVPVGAAEACVEFRREVDEVVCGMTPEPFHAVGLWYEDFHPTTDQEVRGLLQLSRSPGGSAAEPGGESNAPDKLHGPA